MLKGDFGSMAGKRRDTKEQTAQNACNGNSIKQIIDDFRVKVLCESLKCPNRCQCIPQGLATFLVMGDICTRSCTLCSTKKGKPLPLDSEEPLNIARAAKQLNLKYLVLASVTRDDLPNGGAGHIASNRFMAQNRLKLLIYLLKKKKCQCHSNKCNTDSTPQRMIRERVVVLLHLKCH